MKKLRICMVTSFYPPYHAGGCGIHVYQLANLLAQKGHHIEVVSCIDSFRLKVEKKREGKYPHHKNVKLHYIKSRFGKLSPLITYFFGYPLFTAHRFKKILAKGFDVIHYQNISLFGGLRALEFGKAIKLFTLHTYWLFCPTHYLWKYKKKVCEKKTCFLCQLKYRIPPQLWRYTSLKEKMLENVNSLIIPSKFMVKKHQEEGINIPMKHIPYFVFRSNQEVSNDKTKEFERFKPFFLFVARLEPYKGVQVAINAFLKKKGDSRLIVVGAGSLMNEMKKLAENDPRIIFLGHVHPNDLSWLYQNTIALIAPSLWPEMGNQAVQDAMTCGTPSIVAKNGFLPELVGENDAGLLYSSEEELIAACYIMEKENIREKYSNNARSAYENHYVPEKYIERYYNLIEKFL